MTGVQTCALPIYNSAAYYDGKMFADADDEGEAWKKARDQNKASAPDLGYQVLLYTECAKSGAVNKALWCTFLGSIKEMLRNDQEAEKDPRLCSSVLDYFCTSYPEGLGYATLRSEVEDEMYDLELLEIFGTQVVDHTKDLAGAPVSSETVSTNLVPK